MVCRIPVTGSLIPFCPVVAGKDALACLTPGTQVRKENRLDFTVLDAPVPAGTRVGEIVYHTDDGESIVVPLLSGKAVSRNLAERQDFLGQLKQRLYELSSG